VIEAEDIDFGPEAPGVYVPPVTGVPEEDNGRGEPSPESDEESSWRPVPLTHAAAAGGASPHPDHGLGLVYGDGAETLVSGEPGVGKSMFLAAVMAAEVMAGGRPFYIDFERTPTMLIERLEAAGLSDAQLAQVLYLRPQMQAEAAAIRAMVAELAPTLVAVDSYDAALAAFGFETKNEDVRGFHAAVLEPLRSAGSPLVVADHVVKRREDRGRYSIGGSAKLALAEAHLGLTAVTPLRRGTGGKLKARVHKDTFGHLPTAALFRLNVHPVSGAVSWDVSADDGADDDGEGFRPTGLMEKVSRALEVAGEPQSRNKLEEAVKGKRDYVRQAITCLVREGFAEEVSGPRSSRLVALVRPYREDDE
jgi:hypothetical protein